MRVITDMILITIVVVYIIDLSGIVNTIKRRVWSIFMPRHIEYDGFSIKPFDCSLCSTWWAGLCYITYIGEWSLLNVVIVALFSFYAENINHLMVSIKDLLGMLTNKIG